MKQHFCSDRYGEVLFEDLREKHHATRCQPRDIKIFLGEDCRRLREEITIDIRLGQGAALVGAARGMKHV